ncbi:hypothetical protein A6R68_23676, partial [Neotoma lepida]
MHELILNASRNKRPRTCRKPPHQLCGQVWTNAEGCFSEILINTTNGHADQAETVDSASKCLATLATPSSCVTRGKLLHTHAFLSLPHTGRKSGRLKVWVVLQRSLSRAGIGQQAGARPSSCIQKWTPRQT